MVDTPEDDITVEAGPSGTKPENEPIKRRITLVNGDQTVEMEGPDDLDEMAKLAAYFWLLTAPPKKSAIGFSAGSALITELTPPGECE